MKLLDKIKGFIFGGRPIAPVRGGQVLINTNPSTGQPVRILPAEPGTLGERMLPGERISNRQPVRRSLRK